MPTSFKDTQEALCMLKKFVVVTSRLKRHVAYCNGVIHFCNEVCRSTLLDLFRLLVLCFFAQNIFSCSAPNLH